jgi:chemotaxis family two-component system response regulator Rcp1
MTKRLHILLVEDTPSDIRLTQEALKETDLEYKLTVLNDGEQAMDFFKKVAGSDEQPDIVLLDLNMPKKNGHEVLAEMKQIPTLKEVPVILLTVSRDEDEILKALDLRMNYYMGKPVTSDKLNTLLKAIQEVHSGEHAVRLEGEDAHVRYVMAGNPHTSPAVLTKLATERHARIRMRVAENPQTPREVLEGLANDPQSEVRLGIAENPKAPPELLERLAKDPNEDVRLSLASNPRLPQHILRSLSADELPHIAAVADKSLSSGGGEQHAM